MNNINFGVEGKTALITGAVQGIGYAIVEKFASAGMHVYITSRQPQKIEAVIHTLKNKGLRVSGFLGDATNENFVRESVERIIKEKNAIDVLVNNVGAYEHKEIENMDVHDWQLSLGVNLTSSFLWAKEIVPHMKVKRSGRIINVSSIAGISGRKGALHYSAAKGGLISFTKGLAKDLGAFNITVNALAPANIETETLMATLPKNFLENEKERTALGRFGKPEDVAGAALFLTSSLADFITGQVLIVDGGRSII